MKKILAVALVGLMGIAAVLAVSCGKEKKDDGTQQYTNAPLIADTEVYSITIIGNSIVKHPVAPALGWNHDWGMAASSEDKDLVHLIQAQVHEIAPGVSVKWSNIGSSFEANWETYDLKSSAITSLKDNCLLIIKLQENVTPDNGTAFTQTEIDNFIKRYKELIGALSGSDKTQVIVCGGFWPTYDNVINEALKKFAANKYPFIRLDDMFSNATYRATEYAEINAGVANHPSDAGMAEMARRIMEVVKKYNLKK